MAPPGPTRWSGSGRRTTGSGGRGSPTPRRRGGGPDACWRTRSVGDGFRLNAARPSGSRPTTRSARSASRRRARRPGRRRSATAIGPPRPGRPERRLPARSTTRRRPRGERARRPRTATGPIELVAPMPGQVLAIHAPVGTDVDAGDPVVTLEAMKMEHVVTAPVDGHRSASWPCRAGGAGRARPGAGDRRAARPRTRYAPPMTDPTARRGEADPPQPPRAQELLALHRATRTAAQRRPLGQRGARDGDRPDRADRGRDRPHRAGDGPAARLTTADDDADADGRRVRIYEVGPRDGLQNEAVADPDRRSRLRFIELPRRGRPARDRGDLLRVARGDPPAGRRGRAC